MDEVRLEWVNRNIVRGYNLKDMVINAKDKVGSSRGIDEPQKVSFAFLKDLAEDWLSFAFRKASGIRLRITCVIALQLVSVVIMLIVVEDTNSIHNH